MIPMIDNFTSIAFSPCGWALSEKSKTQLTTKFCGRSTGVVKDNTTYLRKSAALAVAGADTSYHHCIDARSKGFQLDGPSYY